MIKIKQKHNLDFYEKEKEINKLKEKIISLKKGKNNINMNNFDDKKSKIINISKESFNLSTEKFRYFPLKIIKRKKILTSKIYYFLIIVKFQRKNLWQILSLYPLIIIIILNITKQC